MKVDFRENYRAETLAYYTTYTAPAEIMQSLAANRTLMPRIADSVANAIGAEAVQYMNDPMKGRIVDSLV